MVNVSNLHYDFNLDLDCLTDTRTHMPSLRTTHLQMYAIIKLININDIYATKTHVIGYAITKYVSIEIRFAELTTFSDHNDTKYCARIVGFVCSIYTHDVKLII